MKQVSELPTTGQFVAVWEKESNIHCSKYKHIKGNLFYLCEGLGKYILADNAFSHSSITYFIVG